ncbi:hypothetical protein QYF61_006768 [Mycteria americana]|uniref:Integrase catalytic domain-containing protein n=1 Tax=Mycteria americana TaxID=33587 RepID=A0AAN7MXQ9_MYCAM|nr:hypothetical protein QYF61_006768 [Mycteria americana]
MDAIAQVIHECETCAAIKQAKRLKPLWYGGQWLKYKYGEAWQIGYITLPQTRQGKHYALAMVEATTGWLETYPVSLATAWNTILGLAKQVLWQRGTPERIESDNGTHFRNDLIDTWAKEHGTEWVYHTPYHAPASGKTRQYNGLSKTTLRAMGDSKEDMGRGFLFLLDNYGHRFVLKFQHVRHGSTQQRRDFIQATIVSIANEFAHDDGAFRTNLSHERREIPQPVTTLDSTGASTFTSTDGIVPTRPLAKQPQFPQPLLIRLLLQTLHQLRCPSLDSLQHLNVSLVVRGPKLNTVFEVWPHQCQVQGHDHFPSPAGHAIFDTTQDAIGFVGHLGTLPAHIQAAVNQHPQVLLCQAAFQPLLPKSVALHGVAVAQVQDLAQIEL